MDSDVPPRFYPACVNIWDLVLPVWAGGETGGLSRKGEAWVKSPALGSGPIDLLEAVRPA